MADEYNPQIGANLDDIDAALRRLDRAADEMVAASRAARRQGVEPSRRDVETETARARQQQVAFNRPLTQAQQGRLDAEIQAAKAAERQAASGRGTAAKQEGNARQIEAAQQRRVDAERRLADLEREHATATKARLSQAQRLALKQAAEAGSKGATIAPTQGRTLESLEKRGLIRVQPSPTGGFARSHITEAGRGVGDPLLIAGDIQKQRQYIQRLVDEEGQAQRALTDATARQAAQAQRVVATRQQYQSPIGPANASPTQRYIEAEQRAERLYWAERARKVFADRSTAASLSPREESALRHQLAQAPDVNPRAVREAQEAARALRAQSDLTGGIPRIGQASAGYGAGRQGSRNVESRGDTLAKRLEKAAQESDRFTARMYRVGESQERLFGSTERAVQATEKASRAKEAAAASDVRRMRADQVRPGDFVGRTKSGLRQVEGVDALPQSTRIRFAGGANIRPGHEIELWVRREAQASQEATEATHARAAAERQAATRVRLQEAPAPAPGTGILPRSTNYYDANALRQGPRFGSYPYAPIGREQQPGATDVEGVRRAQTLRSIKVVDDFTGAISRTLPVIEGTAREITRARAAVPPPGQAVPRPGLDREAMMRARYRGLQPQDVVEQRVRRAYYNPERAADAAAEQAAQRALRERLSRAEFQLPQSTARRDGPRIQGNQIVRGYDPFILQSGPGRRVADVRIVDVTPSGSGGGTRPPGGRPPVGLAGPGPGGGVPFGDPQRAAAQQNALATAVEGANRGIQRQTAYLNASSRAYRQHGALTTEFIEAAARGETSYREWGYQIGATAAKFAGWTAVSIPVFAAIDGIRQIGQGALDSADGVNQLQRVIDTTTFNPRQAQAGFRQLSQEFNVPIETAARAVYLAGQRFHNFDDAVKAARTSLYAFKTGELDIETGTQQLNAVTQAFGLTADDLATVYDKINAAQNEFGAQQADLIAGLARAGGAFRNAGGDVDSLITLLVAARVAAGRTGSQAATAIQRSAGYYRRPSNQAQLQSFGINPNQPFYRDNGPSVLGQAVDVTRTLQQRGDRDSIRLLAQALSSPEFASMFEPILLQAANTGQLANIARGVRENAPDSAATELRTLLGSPREQINALGNELERFGSNLASSGILTVVTGMVGGFRHLLGATNSVGAAFGKLPESVRAATIAFGLARGGLLLARRGGLGENSDTAVGRFFTRAPEQQARVATRQAMREYSESLRADQQQFAQQARRSFVVSANRTERFQTSLREGPTPAERINDPLNQTYANRLNAERDAMIAARGQARALESEREVIDARARDQLALRNQARRAARAGNSYDFAVQSGFIVNPVQNRPSLPYEPSALGRNRRLGTFSREAQVMRQMEEFGSQAIPIGARTGKDVTAYLKQAELAEEATRTKAAMGGIRHSLTESGAGLRTLASGARSLGVSLLDAIGPIGIIIAGVEATYLIWKAGMDREARKDERAGRQGETAYTPQQRTDQVVDARKVINETERKAGRGRLSDFDYQQNLKDARNDNPAYQAALARVAEFNSERATNTKLRSKGLAQVFQTRKDIEGQFQEIERQFKFGQISVDDRAKALTTLLQEIDQGNIRPNTQKFLRRRITTAIDQERTPQSLTARLFGDVDALDRGTVEKQADQYGKLIQAGGGTKRDFSGYFDRQIALLANQALDRSTQGRTAYAERSKQLSDTLEGAAQVELQRGLDTARTAGDRRRAYATYYERVDHADEDFKKRLAGVRKDQGSASKALADFNRSSAARSGESDRPTAGRTSGVADSIGRQRKLLEARVEAANGDAQRISKALQDYRKGIAPKVAAMREQERQEEQSVTDVGQYDYSTGVDRTAYLLRRAGAARRLLIRQGFNRHGKEVSDAIAEERQLDEQLASDQLARYDAETGLVVANAGINDDARSGAQLSRLRGRLALLKNPKHGKVDVNAVIDTETQIRELLNDRLRSVQQDATDLLRAQYNLRESMTDDPVKIAQLEEQFARAVVRRGGFKNEADRMNAVAEKNKAIRATRDARLQSRSDDIEFDLSMERISVEDAASRYEAMARIHGIGKAQKRQYLQRARDLRKQAEQDTNSFDLDVGSIKMPTIYDVRRAFAPIHSGIRTARQHAPQIIASHAQRTIGDAVIAGRGGADVTATAATAVINVTVNDPNAASDVYHAIDRAMKTNVRAKMRSRRHR